ncbi:hypothetical protein WP2W18E01_28530 [Aeromonas caviae]|uniref:Uncharacterized protein n=1 Tax=Aeromonas caviae TaxID=648 RepID=A0A6S4T9H7_AERCA|nr:hypothetical protein WP2W18E01_28530 [Aeromonas caviae]
MNADRHRDNNGSLGLPFFMAGKAGRPGSPVV